jgi:hypothetical protein
MNFLKKLKYTNGKFFILFSIYTNNIRKIKTLKIYIFIIIIHLNI